MKHEITKTENYLLVVDDSKIKEGDYRVNIQRGYVKLVDDAPEYYNQRNDVFKKVIAHLPLGSPILQGVDLLPALEQQDDVWKHGLEDELNKLPYTKHLDDGQYNDGQLAGFEFGANWGYNKAKEKYKYTERDLSIAIALYMDNKSFSEIIQSLSQSKMPIGFECETIFLKEESTGTDLVWGRNVPKTTTNPEGHTQWVGKYIY